MFSCNLWNKVDKYEKTLLPPGLAQTQKYGRVNEIPNVPPLVIGSPVNPPPPWLGTDTKIWQD
jgi:hypothetical protein